VGLKIAMHAAINTRNLDLWAGIEPSRMWAAFREGLDASVSFVFAADRPKPGVQVRPEPLARRDAA
jgi:hypothetical protein